MTAVIVQFKSPISTVQNDTIVEETCAVRKRSPSVSAEENKECVEGEGHTVVPCKRPKTEAAI